MPPPEHLMINENGDIGGHLSDTPKKSPRHVHRNPDDVHVHAEIVKLKCELEEEKSQHKQFQHEKAEDMKQLRESFEREKDRSAEILSARHRAEQEQELQKMRELLVREKDLELRQVLRYKDEEVKRMKVTWHQEKNDAVKVALQLQKKAIMSQKQSTDARLIKKLQQELTSLKELQRDLQEQYQIKCDSDHAKTIEIKKLKQEHESEINKILKEARRGMVKEQHQIRSMEKLLQAKDLDNLNRKTEKEVLYERLQNLKRSSSNDTLEKNSPMTSTPNSGNITRNASVEKLLEMDSLHEVVR